MLELILSSKTDSISNSVMRLDMPVVKEALNFKAKQKAHTLSIKPDLEKREDVLYHPGICTVA